MADLLIQTSKDLTQAYFRRATIVTVPLSPIEKNHQRIVRWERTTWRAICLCQHDCSQWSLMTHTKLIKNYTIPHTYKSGIPTNLRAARSRPGWLDLDPESATPNLFSNCCIRASLLSSFWPIFTHSILVYIQHYNTTTKCWSPDTQMLYKAYNDQEHIPLHFKLCTVSVSW